MAVENEKSNDKSQNEFCLNDYDCIGFDMDHTMVQYDLPQLYKVIFLFFPYFCLPSYPPSCLTPIFMIFSRAHAGKTRRIIYKHQQVETIKCRSNISRNKLFFKNIIYLVFNCYYASTSLARLPLENLTSDRKPCKCMVSISQNIGF